MGMMVRTIEEEMGAQELLGWFAFYGEAQREKEVERGNLMAMTGDEIVSRFTNNG